MVSQKPQQNKKRKVFGPVPSRRLGRSLGIDLVPFKTCTFDCIYCQLGKTNNTTLQRAEYVPISDTLCDLKEALKKTPDPDFITLSGSGEPTLHSKIDDVIKGVRAITRLPIAVLTNGSLLNDEKVRAACCLADVVLPSLDAGDEETFIRINRPAKGLTFQGLLEGLTAFRQEFSGQIWLEVFLVHGVNCSSAAVSRIAHAAASIRPDQVHLNTAVRPAAEGFVRSVPDLERYAGFFRPVARFSFSPPSKNSASGLWTGQLFETLKRRPCTLEDMASILNVPPVEITKYIEEMVSRGELVIRRHGSVIYYSTALIKCGQNSSDLY